MKLRLTPLLLLGLSAARADVSLAPLFTDHAVLQRGKPAPVWGRAEPGEKVTVTFAGRSVSAVAGKGGRWIAYLGPLEASAAGADLTVAGRNTRVLHDVVVGEVWVCSGQSNMEFVVDDPKGDVFHVVNAKEEVAAARYPLIRQFKVVRRVAEAPTEEAAGAWTPCSPETAPEFTAVGYFFARDLHLRLGVPVGIVDSTWGGTPIESWLPAEMLAADPAFAVVAERWRQTLAEYPRRKAEYPALLAKWEADEAEAKAKGAAPHAAFLKEHSRPRLPRGAGDQWTPSSLFNGMISPLPPYALRGFLWYQGESNAARALEYRRLFAALIASWRVHFGQGETPFYFVQLANYDVPGDAGGVSYAQLREAQARVLDQPATGMAVTVDIGDPGNIHPRNKQEVGRRLALIAKANLYGIPEDFSGPLFESAERDGNALRVRFRYAGPGLIASGGPLQSFEVAGADRRFFPARASISGEEVRASSPEVPEPVAVRYAWRNAPAANLFNGAGLPASPFRSDDW